MEEGSAKMASAKNKRNKARYRDIFVAFLRSSILTFGGGPSGIPLIENEAVKHFHWLTLEEYGDVVAIANALPGPINTKLAGYIGWRVRGWLGMLIALLACVGPMVAAMIVLLGVLTTFQHARWVQGMTHAVLPVVGVMMIELTWSFVTSSKKAFGWPLACTLIIASFVILNVLHVQAPILIAVTLVAVLLLPIGSGKESGRNVQ
ncbi:MAG: chromate transporter [Sporolactobacillus sp.]